jgi:predicted nucleic acid-binding protein
MPLADSNVWLALALSKHEFHSAARIWLAERGPHEALFCRSTQQSFLRLLTTMAVLAPYRTPPLNNKAAWSVYDGLCTNERIS